MKVFIKVIILCQNHSPVRASDYRQVCRAKLGMPVKKIR